MGVSGLGSVLRLQQVWVAAAVISPGAGAGASAR